MNSQHSIRSKARCVTFSTMSASLESITAALHHIAPLELAEAWDNVGLLIAPSEPRTVRRILLTIDLTRAVAEEAAERKAEMVIAYHPPIFKPLSRLAGPSVPVRMVERRIAVYSPHTALDSTPGGVNDWLADGLGAGERRPIQPYHPDPADSPHAVVKLVVFVPTAEADRLRDAMADAGAGWIGNYSHCSYNLEGYGTFLGREGADPAVGERGRLERVEEVRLEMVCPPALVPDVIERVRATHPYEEPAFDVYPTELAVPAELSGAGQGRRLRLEKPATLNTLVRRIKKHLMLKRVRVATAAGHDNDRKLSTIALCAGAGGSVLAGQPADLYLTGEMRHHDILAANARGTSVVLTDHTNTERGYLPTLRSDLANHLDRGIKIDISENDADPLEVV